MIAAKNKQATAANELQRYADTYTKYNENELSEKHGFKMLGTMIARIEMMHDVKGVPASES